MEFSHSERRARQILIWLGAAEQHLATRMNRLLRGADLPFAQFVVLDHLASLPDEIWTVTRLASALDTGQPGVSKILARLADKGYVRIEADPADRRIKRHRLTEAGLGVYHDAFQRIAPHAGDAFADWQETDLDALHALLYKLKSSLRESRTG
jgi:DNA-binding MarR family transcriptional regulator